jgi:Ras-related protein Rab-18
MYTSPEVVKMIVGNKVDKETFSREVSTKEGEEFAKRMNCLFIGEWRWRVSFLPR